MHMDANTHRRMHGWVVFSLPFLKALTLDQLFSCSYRNCSFLSSTELFSTNKSFTSSRHGTKYLWATVHEYRLPRLTADLSPHAANPSNVSSPRDYVSKDSNNSNAFHFCHTSHHRIAKHLISTRSWLQAWNNFAEEGCAGILWPRSKRIIERKPHQNRLLRLWPACREPAVGLAVWTSPATQAGCCARKGRKKGQGS